MKTSVLKIITILSLLCLVGTCYAQVPATPGAISGLTTVCSNTTQTYSVAPVAGALFYNWSLPSGWTGSSSSNSITLQVGPGTGTISVNAGNVSGNSANTVPDLAVLEIDARSFSQAELERIDQAIKSLAATTSGARLEVTGGLNRPPLQPSSTKELYERAERVAKEIGMAPLGCAEVGGASDGNFAAAAGAQVLDGLGAVGGGAHAPHEWLSLKSIEERSALLHALIKDLLK